MNETKQIIFLFQIESHCDTDCPKAPIACNFSTFGCKERVSDQMLSNQIFLVFQIIYALLKEQSVSWFVTQL